jgi:hypothetical protein
MTPALTGDQKERSDAGPETYSGQLGRWIVSPRIICGRLPVAGRGDHGPVISREQ